MDVGLDSVNELERIDTTKDGYNGSDPLKLYFDEISRIPRLGAEDENALVAKIAAGREAGVKLAEVCPMGAAEGATLGEVEALHRTQALGEQAQKALVEGNLRWVAFLVQSHAHSRVQWLDLIQEGNMLLVKAAAEFDCTLGVSFASVVKWRVHKAFQSVDKKSTPIAISEQMLRAIEKLRQVSQRLVGALGHEPTPEELAHEMNVPIGIARQVMAAIRLAERPTSLDVPVGEDGDTCLGEFITGEVSNDPFDVVALSLLREQIDRTLETLTPEEEAVIRLRFGFEDGCTYSVDEVCAAIPATHDGVQHIEAKAMRKLRHPSRSRQLQGFLY